MAFSPSPRSVADASTHPPPAANPSTLSPSPPAFASTPSLSDPASAPSPQASELSETAPQPARTTLLFTGVIVPARCVQAAVDERGQADYIYNHVRDLIRSADLAIGTLNATLSDITPRTGCVATYLLTGSSDNADALARAGFDLMSVATNHIKNCGLPNCGDQAFFDTLDNLQRVGIIPIGAGKDHDEAMSPVVTELNGVRFGFISLGHIEPMAFAGEDTPGIAVLTEENLHQAIAAARQVSDVVVAMPHWGPEDSAMPGWIQMNLARAAVEAGADLVVGNHTHVVQAYQEIEGVMVFYGLGNFVFDQTWSRHHMQGVILLVHFDGARFAGFELIPTIVEEDGTVYLAAEREAAEVLERIEEVNRRLP